MIALISCFVNIMPPTAMQTKMAKTKTMRKMLVAAMGPLMLHQFAKLPAIAMLFAKVRIHAKHITMLNVVINELKNKSNVFIFLRVLCSRGGCDYYYMYCCVHQHHARDDCDLVRCKQLPGRRARCCVVSCCLTMQRYIYILIKPNKTAKKVIKTFTFNAYLQI